MKKKNSGTGSVGTFFYRKTVDFEMSAHLTYLETEGSFKLWRQLSGRPFYQKVGLLTTQVP